MTTALAEKHEVAPQVKQKRMRRLQCEVRVEIETRSSWISAQARDFTARGVSVLCGSSLQVGEPINALLYIPKDNDFDLIRVSGEVVWSKEQQGLFTLGAAFHGFAPGDERRFRSWLLAEIQK